MAELGEAGAFGIAGHIGFKHNIAKLVRRAAGRAGKTHFGSPDLFLGHAADKASGRLFIARNNIDVADRIVSLCTCALIPRCAIARLDWRWRWVHLDSA